MARFRVLIVRDRVEDRLLRQAWRELAVARAHDERELLRTDGSVEDANGVTHVRRVPRTIRSKVYRKHLERGVPISAELMAPQSAA